MMSSYKDHKELILNIVRILSKISLSYEALDVLNLFGDEFILTLSEILIMNKDSNSILIRAAFVLGNLTTVYEDSRKALLKDGRFWKDLMGLSKEVFLKDLKKKDAGDKKVDFNRDSTEDALTKIIRLVANLLTESSSKPLLQTTITQIDSFFRCSLQALQVKTLEKSEECILNIVA